MKRKLNPDLVREKYPMFPFDESWVFLRDPKDIAPHSEVGIGPVEIEVIPEKKDDVADVEKQIKNTEVALAALAGLNAAPDPHIILTRDCLGIEGPVRLLIYSNKPFKD